MGNIIYTQHRIKEGHELKMMETEKFRVEKSKQMKTMQEVTIDMCT